jgi:hypothetical protein
MPVMSLGVPRTENSTQARGMTSGAAKEIRPDSLVMKSIFSPLSVMISASPAMSAAVTRLPSRVMMCRCLPWARTQCS